MSITRIIIIYMIKNYFMLSNYVNNITSLNNYKITSKISNKEDILCTNKEHKLDKEKQKKKTEDTIKEISKENESLVEDDDMLENMLFNLTIKNYINNPTDTKIDPQVYRDLGIYDSILKKININYTKAGKIYLIHHN